MAEDQTWYRNHRLVTYQDDDGAWRTEFSLSGLTAGKPTRDEAEAMARLLIDEGLT